MFLRLNYEFFLLSKELSQPTLEPEDAAPPSWIFYNAMHNALMSVPTTLPSVSEECNLTAIEQQSLEEEAARLEVAFRDGQIVGDNEDDVDDEEGDVDEEILEESEMMEDLSEEEDADDGDDNQDEDEGEVDLQVDDNGFLRPSEDCVDSVWTPEKIHLLIELRRSKEAEIAGGSMIEAYSNIVEDLGMVGVVSSHDVKKKWMKLVRQYLSVKEKMKDSSSEEIQIHIHSVEGVETVTGYTEGMATSWVFYDAMNSAMEDIKKISPEKSYKCRKSPDFIWVVDTTKKFIKLRGNKHSEIAHKGHNIVYQEILDKLGISDKVTIMMARKKWNYLVKRYQDEELAGGPRSWAFFNDMAQVMKHFKGRNASKLKSRASPEFLWPNELTKKFIQLRVNRQMDFADNGIQNTYAEIMEELGVGHILNPNQLRKKWNYLVAKYKEISNTTGTDGKCPAPHSWPFYEDMNNALQQIPENAIHGNRVMRSNLENIWTKEVILKFIELRGTRSPDTPKKVSLVCAEIIEELGLTGVITANQARKKWNYLWSKYLVCIF